MKWLIPLVFLATPVFSQNAPQPNNCAPRDVVLKKLSGKYKETRHAIMLGAQNAIVEIYANLETETWTIAVTSAGGPMCVVASGIGYENTDEDLTPTGSKL